MGKRTAVGIAVMLALSLLAAQGLTGCTREKPAPTSTWITPGPTTVMERPAGAAATAVISPDATAPSAGAEATPRAPTVTPALITPQAPTTAVTVVAPTPAPPTPAPQPSGSTYTVRSGDTLYSIAQRYGTTVQELARLNGLASADSIMVGQVLRLPGSGAEPVAPAAPVAATYVVQRGDTLYSIAKRYGVELAALMVANDISNPNRIYVGQQLSIPGGAAPAAGDQRVHVVQRGETLLDIAVLYGVSLKALLELNDISNPDTIYVGQQVVIP